MRTCGMRTALAAILVLGVAVSACEIKLEPERSLYDRLGGLDAITGVVDKFVANVAVDERINERFADTNLSRFKIRLIQQICEATGGPCEYQGEPMAVVHKGMNITVAEFNATGEDLAEALDDSGVPEKEKNELLAMIGAMQNQIVGQ